ncbi:unnamed protein product [Closterium sp. NIES-53]
MASRVLVSGLPRSLPPLPPRPAPTCVPCIEGRQRAAPHSSEFPPTEAPLQTLHMDVWGPARIRGQGHERYFLMVVDDFSRYTTVFPLHRKDEVTEVLIDWIRVARLQLRERFGSDFPILCLHSDRGGEFSSDLLRAFCRAEGIRQTFTLPASPQQNGVAERRIGMVMDVAPFVRDLSADKLSSRAVPCVFLGFPPDAPGWQFYHPTSRRVLSSKDARLTSRFRTTVSSPTALPPLPPPPLFLKPVPPPVDPLPPQGPAPSGVSQVDAVEPVEVAVDSGASGGAELECAEPGGAGPRGARPESAVPGGAGSGGAEPECAEPGGAGSGGAERGGAVPTGAGPGGSSGSVSAGGTGAAGPGGATRAGACASVGGTAGAGAPGGTGAGAPGGTGAGGAAGAGAPEGAGVGAPGAAGVSTGASGAAGVGADTAGAGVVPAGSGGAARPWPYFVLLLEQVLGLAGTYGVDYFQTFSPTSKMTTLRVLLHVAAQRDYELHSLEFSTAFLQGSLDEEMWLRRPPGFTGSFPPGTRTQWSLRRPVYGLRQAPREWHDTLRTTLAALGFAPSTADLSLFLRTDTLLPPFYILVYVDDLVFATADTAGLAHVKSELQKRHTCTDLGELRSYLVQLSPPLLPSVIASSFASCFALPAVLITPHFGYGVQTLSFSLSRF